ncbi:hypothetical protein AA101099_0496 [Neoasaia chiangmaiensis NBRC 101099]|nr:hypothetical protein AA101099_0496 [Neoasaia chiangmaiensis NBRC 101099]GEN16710.1 hypothetical protein NCH01_31410 [Neoasaia chiangmaiensis]
MLRTIAGRLAKRFLSEKRGLPSGRTPDEAELVKIYGHLPMETRAQPENPFTIAEADYRARHWRATTSGTLRPGTADHKRAVADMFRETFNPYRPSVIAWPKLDPETLKRITSLPIWDIAVETEGKARLRMAAYAATMTDPEMRDAIARNAWEENRHKEVLTKLVEAYQIGMAPEPPYVVPRDAEWAYLVTGFSECVDSFFAFGLFELAGRSGLFPEELIETFEPVMQEECRHILLFANWLAWHRTTLTLYRRVRFEFRVLAVWLFLAYERIGMVRTLDGNGEVHDQDNNFTISGTKDVSDTDIGLRDILGVCLSENARRFSGYDPRLKRPRMMPTIAALLRTVLPRRRPGSPANRSANIPPSP